MVVIFGVVVGLCFFILCFFELRGFFVFVKWVCIFFKSRGGKVREDCFFKF